MRIQSMTVALLLLFGGGCGDGAAGDDAGAHDDSGTTDASTSRSDAGSAADSGTRVDAGSTMDASPPPGDGGLAVDSGAPADGGPPTDAGPEVGRCEPTGGSMVFPELAVNCAGIEIAVMRGITSPRIEVRGDLQIVGRERSDCLAVDSARIIAPDGHVAADLGASSGREGSPFGPPLASGPIAEEVSAVCDENERFDRFRVELSGRVDGGTFTGTCGRAGPPSSFWPPKTTVTCHRGIGRVPGELSATEVLAGLDELRVSFPLVPGGPTPETLIGSSQMLFLARSLGFRSSVTVGGGPHIGRSLSNPISLGGIPGLEFLATSESMSCAAFDDRDMHLVRLEGTTDRGPFVTETRFSCH